jgi:hypothetical protein
MLQHTGSEAEQKYWVFSTKDINIGYVCMYV